MNAEQRINYLKSLASIKYSPDAAVSKGYDCSDGMPTVMSLSVTNGLVLEHKNFRVAVAKIASIHLRSLLHKEVYGLLLSGQSGVGKTQLINWYKSNHPQWTDGGVDIKPVVIVTTPTKPLVSDLAEEILRQLGDPMPHLGTKTTKTKRIHTLLKTCRVEMLFLDELQHFLEHGNAAMREVSNWLKNLISTAQIPIVVVGMPRCESIIQNNEQMGRRFCRRHYLTPFSPNNASWNEFRGVLKTLHTKLEIRAVEFHRPDIALRFYYASAGLLDYVIRTINTAVEVAQGRRVGIDLDVLGEAFTETVWSRAPRSLNPFLCAADQCRLLTRPGEPFELWDTTSPAEGNA